MRVPNRFSGVILKAIASAIIGVLLFLMVSGGGTSASIIKAYSSLSGTRNVNEIAKKYTFVAKYTYATGDISFAQAAGFTREEAEVMQTSGTLESSNSGESSASVSNVPSSINTDDMREMAKLVCQSYLINGQAHYVANSGTYASTPYPTITINGIDIPPYTSSSGTVYNRCCNGLSSALLRATGITTYRTGANISAGWPYISCTDILNKVGTVMHPTTFGDLRVGDIICVQSSSDANRVAHVETVVYIDDSGVYIASAGSSDNIALCANQGWSRKRNATDRLDEKYSNRMSSGWNGVKGVVRP